MNSERQLKKEFILKQISPYKKHIAILIFLFFIASVFDGISIGMLVPLLASLQQVQNYEELPKILQSIIELFAGYPVEKQVIISLVFVVTSLLLKNLFLAVSRYLGYWLTTRLIVNLRSQVIGTLMVVGIGFYNNVKTGDLVEKTIFNTIMTEEIIKNATELIDYFASFTILMTLLIIFSWKLTIFTVILAALIAFGVSIYIRRLSLIGEKLLIASREVTASIHENISGIQVIKSFTKESKQTEVINAQIEKSANVHLKLIFGNYMVHIITEVLGVIAIGIIFVIAINISDMNYKIVLTQLLPFIYILARMLPIMKMINQSRGVIVSRWPGFEAVYDLIRLDNKPLIKDGNKNFTGIKSGIHFKSVSFSYNDDDKYALNNVDFLISKGKTTAIVGQSGAGKSTITNLLLRFYDPQGGNIFIDDEPLTDLKINSYRKNIGIVSQDTFIFNDTVRNNIAFGALEETSDDRVIEAAKRAGAHDFILKLPDGYDTILGERGIKLSGGQRQRISIARAILKDPAILILDEATSSLDSTTEQLIHKAITELSRNRTVIIIAHRLSTIKNADQIIVLKDGSVSEIGNEKELLSNEGEYYKLAQSNIILDDAE
ncbi:MAG: ABC transporter ATP-binding protein [Candidatus Dadabacteria bacterium]|nr:ABC transporter ATP-binding protein [Candidatus Dadabacteria bacterium]